MTINSVNGGTTIPSGYPASKTIALTTGGGGNCTADTTGTTGLNCTVTIAAPLGAVSYTFTVFDSNNDQLATGTTTVTIGQSGQHLNVALNAIVASVQIAPPTLAWGQNANGTLDVTYFDASGAQIVGGTFAGTVTITDSDTNALELSIPPAAPGPSVIVSQTNDTVSYTYDGTQDSQITFTYTTPSSGGGSQSVHPSRTITITNTTTDTLSPSDPNYNKATIYFSGVGNQQNFTASETGWSTAGHGFTITLDPTTCGSGAAAVVKLTSTDNMTFVATSANPGICLATVTGAPGQHAPLWFSVTAGGGLIH